MVAATYLIAAVRPYRLRVMDVNMNINIHGGFEPDRGMGKLSTGGIGPGATLRPKKRRPFPFGDPCAPVDRNGQYKRCGYAGNQTDMNQ